VRRGEAASANMAITQPLEAIMTRVAGPAPVVQDPPAPTTPGKPRRPPARGGTPRRAATRCCPRRARGRADGERDYQGGGAVHHGTSVAQGEQQAPIAITRAVPCRSASTPTTGCAAPHTSWRPAAN
jgi:hypothetical protein